MIRSPGLVIEAKNLSHFLLLPLLNFPLVLQIIKSEDDEMIFKMLNYADVFFNY